MKSIFESINNENFIDYMNSIERCVGVSQSIFFTLDSYKVIRGNPQQEAIKVIEVQLRGAANAIELEKAYKLFCELVGAEYKVKGEKAEVVPVLLLAEAIQPHSVPLFPWQSSEDNDFQVYTNPSEEFYYSDLKDTKSKRIENSEKKVNFKFIFDRKNLAVIQEMKRHIRSREILSMYQTILLMQKMEELKGVPQEKARYKNIDYKILNEGTEVTEYKLSDHDKIPVKAVNKAEELFKKHFHATEKLLEERGTIKFDERISEDQWAQFQKKMVTFGQCLFQIEQLFKPTLIELDNHIKNRDSKERENNKIFSEVNDFLKKNNLATYENGVINKLPTARQISATKPGGPGVLKKITDSGGLPKFEENLKLFLEKNKRIIPDLRPQSLEMNSYEGSFIRGTLKNEVSNSDS